MNLLSLPGQTDVRYDQVGDLEYFGFAQSLGSATSAPVWQIFRLNNAPGGGEELVKRYADGESTFSKVWDDRASYTYGG